MGLCLNIASCSYYCLLNLRMETYIYIYIYTYTYICVLCDDVYVERKLFMIRGLSAFHRLFLLGLQKYGKGDWRNISRNFVVTRTPTQVASHAQKYFIRQGSGGKDKRRSSIHDITTVNLADSGAPPSPAKSPALAAQPGLASSAPPETRDQFSLLYDQTQAQARGSLIMPHHYGIGAYGDLKSQVQNVQRGGLSEAQLRAYNVVYQMQPSHYHHHPHG